MAVTVLLVRHGETDWNAQRRWQGQQGEGLNTLGLAQAQAVAERLMSAASPATSDVRVVASDLERTQQTAEIVGSALSTPVSHDARLREIDVGSWSGLTHQQVAERNPDRRDPWHDADDLPFGGGESITDLRMRARAFFSELETHDDVMVIAITHGGFIRIATATMLGMPAATPLRGCGNGSITEWGFDTPRGWRLVSYNTTDHLKRVVPDRRVEVSTTADTAEQGMA